MGIIQSPATMRLSQPRGLASLKLYRSGFTLIELLVVIAIIGILSAVVLASLSTARLKGQDAAIQSDLASVHTQAEIYRSDNGNAYGTNGLDESDCAAIDNMFADETIQRAVTAADTVNGTTGSMTCNVAADGTAYAVAAQMVSNDTLYWCVDSTGVATSTASALGAATACS